MTTDRRLDAIGGWPGVLGRLASRQDLTGDEAAVAMAEVLAGAASAAQIAAFIVALRLKGETVAEMTGLVRALLDASEPVVLDPALRDRAFDTCGTGGDRSGTVNISTMAAFVVAGAGVPVCKHGNRAASSRAGSADVLEALGVRLDLGPEGVADCIATAGMGFCFAPRFHPGMRHAGPIRKELGIATVFNFLGPLANPARVIRQMVGVSDPAMVERVAGVLVANGARRVVVVHGHGGLDEFSTTGPQRALVAVDGSTSYIDVDPAAFDLEPVTIEALCGGDAETNASCVRQVLSGERGAQRDVVLLNAAAGLFAAGVADSIADGLAAAAKSIDDGAAASVLERLVAVSNA